MEIERKFLVKRDGAFHKYVTSSSHIAQGYMDVKGATVRIRLRDDKAYLTIKGPATGNGLGRYEFETEIPMDDAHELMKLCMPGVVIKDRYLVKSGKHTVEVDEFFGDNEGLVMAEIEFESEDEEYEKPAFLGDEVTGDYHYYNKYMIKHPFKEWGGK